MAGSLASFIFVMLIRCNIKKSLASLLLTSITDNRFYKILKNLERLVEVYIIYINLVRNTALKIIL